MPVPACPVSAITSTTVLTDSYAQSCTMKYFNAASVLYMFLTLGVKGMNDIRLISRPIHAPNHELEDTDISTPPTEAIRRIFVELLGIREETVILYLWGMNSLA